MSTGAILLATVAVTAVTWIVLEIVRLRDDVPNNHITSVVRWAVAKQPGPFILFSFVVGYILGHLTWP
jgi:hypothetical protein